MRGIRPLEQAGGTVTLAAGLLLLGVAGCEPVTEAFSDAATPHEAYGESLHEADLAARGLGAGWFAAAERALVSPLAVELPFRETGFFPADEAEAHGYRIALRRGERLVVNVEASVEAPTRLFLDLFREEPGEDRTWRHVQSADSVTTLINHTIRRDAVYVVRLQPELLRHVRYTLTMGIQPTLAFPVEGRDTEAIRSGFGVDRDGGRRVHHGVDIFAPRGTPVLAAAEGTVEARLNRLGGKVVWQRVPGLGSLYYAHLDSQAVTAGIARVGDTIGFVGNTGNAVTTPPHLHFGIYARPGGPVDPFPFLYEPSTEPPAALAPEVALGGLVRSTPRRAILRSGPQAGATDVDTVPSGTIARLVGGAGEWRRVALPDGRSGFLRSTDLAPVAAESSRRSAVAGSVAIRVRPDSGALAIAELEPGTEVLVLGSFQDWSLVTLPGTNRDPSPLARPPLQGWIPAS